MSLSVRTKSKYYPFLQDISYIRPLRMLSPAAFIGNADPRTENSYPVVWDSVQVGGGARKVKCAGIFQHFRHRPTVVCVAQQTERNRSRERETVIVDDRVAVVRKEKHWEGVCSIKRLVVRRFEDAVHVLETLLDGSLDVVWGAGDLSSLQLRPVRRAGDV